MVVNVSSKQKQILKLPRALVIISLSEPAGPLPQGMLSHGGCFFIPGGLL